MQQDHSESQEEQDAHDLPGDLVVSFDEVEEASAAVNSAGIAVWTFSDHPEQVIVIKAASNGIKYGSRCKKENSLVLFEIQQRQEKTGNNHDAFRSRKRKKGNDDRCSIKALLLQQENGKNDHEGKKDLGHSREH